MEHWNNGLIKKAEMENRSNGDLGMERLTHRSIIPLFHHSTHLS